MKGSDRNADDHTVAITTKEAASYFPTMAAACTGPVKLARVVRRRAPGRCLHALTDPRPVSKR